MLLAINAGNSTTSFALHDGQGFRHVFRLETRPGRAADEYAAFLFPLLASAGVSPTALKGAAAASVVPTVLPALSELCARLRLSLFVVSADEPLPLSLAVRTPAQLGPDRLANAAFAARELPLPAIVVDAGTATTFDLVLPGPVLAGGAIAPGVGLCLRSLSTGTARLPEVPATFPDSVVGRDTSEAIRAGVMFGYRDLVAGLVHRLEEAAGGPCSVALTGGFAEILASGWDTRARVVKHATLEGIRILHAWASAREGRAG